MHAAYDMSPSIRLINIDKMLACYTAEALFVSTHLDDSNTIYAQSNHAPGHLLDVEVKHNGKKHAAIW